MVKPPGYDEELIYFNPNLLMQKQYKRKTKYIVCYKNHYNYGDGRIETDSCWQFLGSTMAVSRDKAISNVRYRNDIHHYANQFHEWACDGLRWIEFKAFTVSEYNNLEKE